MWLFVIRTVMYILGRTLSLRVAISFRKVLASFVRWICRDSSPLVDGYVNRSFLPSLAYNNAIKLLKTLCFFSLNNRWCSMDKKIHHFIKEWTLWLQFWHSKRAVRNFLIYEYCEAYNEIFLKLIENMKMLNLVISLSFYIN